MPEIHPSANIYGTVGLGTKVAAFVEIGGTVGERCKVQAFAFIPPGVVVEDDCFIGPHACFTNVMRPDPYKAGVFLETRVKSGAAVGAGAVILPGVTIGEKAFVGAGDKGC